MKCEGTIPAVLKWKEDYAGEPFPKSVIVFESASASYGAEAFGPGSGTIPGSCNTSLQNEQVIGPIRTPYLSNGVVTGHGWNCSKTAQRYNIKPGGPEITLTCTPTAQCASSGQRTSASVSYKAAAYPVEIALQGATANAGGGGATVLIGRGLKANLVGGGATFTNHNGSFGGGNPFKNWDVASDQSSSSITYVSATDYSAANPLWFYAQDANATVSCFATAIGCR